MFSKHLPQELLLAAYQCSGQWYRVRSQANKIQCTPIIVFPGKGHAKCPFADLAENDYDSHSLPLLASLDWGNLTLGVLLINFKS